MDKEIAIIRNRQAKDKNVHFYPLLMTPTPDIALDLLRDKNLRPREGKAFLDLSRRKRENEMCKIANELGTIAKEITARRNLETVTDTKRRDSNELAETFT